LFHNLVRFVGSFKKNDPMRISHIIICFIFSSFSVYAQNVSHSSTIEKHDNKAEYKISSKFSGLNNVSFAKIKFTIAEEMTTYIPPNSSLTPKLKDNKLNFYSYSIDNSGIINTVFVIGLDEELNGQKPINVQLQYATGEDRKDLLFDPIVISPEKEYPTFEEDYSQYIIETEIKTLASRSINEEIEKTPKESSSNLNNITEDYDTEIVAPPSAMLESGSYTVQILSLSNYNASRIKTFCQKHNLKTNDLINRNVGSTTKVSIGISLSLSQAQNIKRKITEENGIEGAFVVKID